MSVVIVTLFPRNFSRTIADTDIINTPLEPLRPAGVPLGGYKTETKDLGGFFAAKSIFGVSRVNYRMKIRINVQCRAIGLVDSAICNFRIKTNFKTRKIRMTSDMSKKL